MRGGPGRRRLLRLGRRRGDAAGQALPIYVAVVAGLLFLAFAYFAVGQAAASRNDAQGAADAAALAAAQEARDHLRKGLLEEIVDPDNWDDIGNGERLGTTSGCEAAKRYADQNGATLSDNDGDGWSCKRLPLGQPDGFTVEVESKEPVGESVIPGTESEYAEAKATAVIEFDCDVKSEDEREEGDDERGEEDGEEGEPSGTLECDGEDWEIDPDDSAGFPDVSDLFTVSLSE